MGCLPFYKNRQSFNIAGNTNKKLDEKRKEFYKISVSYFCHGIRLD